ncbi:27721_t:CDS:2 [Gigaspora margarita]|uniref:27721_t:CDS:1 n=1 Tax=Gigaspora margarita TaxID=4874 RepID=A0ABN7UZP7_GIGMA|nr:27721_t:CDS:2 [Gigaspora margarita]
MDTTKNSRKELLTVEKKILIEEKLEDGKISSVEDGTKGDHFLLNKKRIIDNVDDSSTKKKMDNRIRVAEMTLNKSELEVLSGENLEEAENKAALLYAECGCLDYGVEDTKKIISLFNKKENFLKTKQTKNALIKAANQMLPKKKILNTGCSRKRSKIKTELEKSILVLGKIIRGIRDGKPQSLDEGEQDLHDWKKILEKKCLTENTISRNKKIRKKSRSVLVLEKQDHSQELITKPEEWAEIYKPASYVQESLYENLLEEISEKE